MNNELEKTMSKKAWKEKCKKHRVHVPFNTGIRTLKSKKDYNRKWKMEEEE